MKIIFPRPIAINKAQMVTFGLDVHEDGDQKWIWIDYGDGPIKINMAIIHEDFDIVLHDTQDIDGPVSSNILE